MNSTGGVKNLFKSSGSELGMESMCKPHTTDKKMSNSYFKRSIIRCVQNYVEKNGNSQFLKTMNEKSNLQKKNRDFVPVNVCFNIDY